MQKLSSADTIAIGGTGPTLADLLLRCTARKFDFPTLGSIAVPVSALGHCFLLKCMAKLTTQARTHLKNANNKGEMPMVLYSVALIPFSVPPPRLEALVKYLI